MCVLCVHFLHTCLSVSKIASPQISFLSSPEFPVLAEHRVAPKKLMFPLQRAGRMCAEMLAVCAEFPVKVRGMSPLRFLTMLLGWWGRGGHNKVEGIQAHTASQSRTVSPVWAFQDRKTSLACLSQYYRVSVTAGNCPPEGQEVL